MFYESHVGAGMICNPLAIFQALIDDPTHKRLRHVWVISTEDEIEVLRSEWKGRRRVTFVLRDSREYVRALATAKYIIQNTSYPPFFVKRPGQVCVNTWHSTTVKTLGFDMPDGNIQSRNVIRSLLISDYIVSPNAFMTKVFRESYRLQDLYTGTVLEMGYPRNDVTLRADRAEVIRRLQARGVRVDPDKKIVLYAPTWRGPSPAGTRADGAELLRVRDEILRGIDTDEYQVLVKGHHLVDSLLTDQERASGDFIPRQVDTNELLAAVDILISDYSSIYFDHLLTGRPVLFYVPDEDEYAEDRGVYFSLDELPGPATKDIADIATWIGDIDVVSEQYRDRYERVRAWACEHDDGRAAERVVQVVFDGQEMPGLIRDFVPAARKRLLFYVAGFTSNGVSSAFRALLERIDRAEYDVTVWGFIRDGASASNYRALTDVRAMPWIGGFSLTRWERIGISYIQRYGRGGKLLWMFRPRRALRREFHRNFGDAEFDYAIDFSGYGVLIPAVLAQHGPAKKVIWQHSDIASEFGNADKRELPRYRGINTTLAGIQDAYARCDRVVACGEPVRDINSAALATPKTEQKFTFVNNLVETSRVKRLAAIEPAAAADGYIVAEVAGSASAQRLTLLPDFPPAPEPGEAYRTFVTIGRLSPEKNHANLIRGFAAFVRHHPNSRLFILGDGDLHAGLEQVAEDLGVTDRVSIAGHLSNPFAIARRCDCFILPSLYEGFGLVVSEVRVLGLPIIVSDFAALGSVSMPGGQYVIGVTPEEICQGLTAFVHGEVPTGYAFNAEEYNAAAYRQFVGMLDSL